MHSRLRALLVAAAVLAASASGCARGSPARPPAPEGAGTSNTVAGPATVFAAASLTAPFNEARTTLVATNPGLSLTYNFAGSNALVTQILQGAPADVFASADTANMAKLVDAGLVGTPVVFARNTLQIAVAAGNPRNIAGLADLANPGVAVVLAAPGVPAGDYTRQVLAARNLAVSPKSLETDVKAALSKVTSGEADATVVYVTDVVAGGSKVTGVAIPDGAQPDISYPIAVVRATRNPAAAQAFVDSATSGTVQKALEAAGFLRPR